MYQKMGIERSDIYPEGFRTNCQVLLNHLRKHGVLSDQQENILSGRLVSAGEKSLILAVLQRDLASFSEISQIIQEEGISFATEVLELLQGTHFYDVLKNIKEQNDMRDFPLAVREANQYIELRRIEGIYITVAETLEDVAGILTRN